jgi:hemoglobin
LLGLPGYQGNPFRAHALVHAKRKFTPAHFERWLTLWNETVDELFAGPRAELAKAHALRVARAFHRRLSNPPALPDDQPAAQSGPIQLTVTHH